MSIYAFFAYFFWQAVFKPAVLKDGNNHQAEP
jgi:hypothetical protein